MGAPYDRESDPENAVEPVDSSAAAIAAQGLLRFAAWLRASERTGGDRYYQAGLSVLRTLLDDRYLSLDRQHQGLLLHSQYHRPNGWDYVRSGHKTRSAKRLCGEITTCASWRFMFSVWPTTNPMSLFQRGRR